MTKYGKKLIHQNHGIVDILALPMKLQNVRKYLMKTKMAFVEYKEEWPQKHHTRISCTWILKKRGINGECTGEAQNGRGKCRCQCHIKEIN